MNTRRPTPSPEPGTSSLTGLHSLTCYAPHERPPYSNFTLVKYAILGSPKQKLTLSEIYLAISTRFPWFQTAGKGWKNSVRHCLSLDTQFLKEPRPPTERGKGSYWTVLNTPRGYKRERKRNKIHTKTIEHVRTNSPISFPLTTPAFPDYAITIPAPCSPPDQPAMLRRNVPLQSGWTPYFPNTMISIPATGTLHENITEKIGSENLVSCHATLSTEKQKKQGGENPSSPTPAMSRDYDTTILAPSASHETGISRMRFYPHGQQSGWTPYFPADVMSAKTTTTLHDFYTEVSGIDTLVTAPGPEQNKSTPPEDAIEKDTEVGDLRR